MKPIAAGRPFAFLRGAVDLGSWYQSCYRTERIRPNEAHQLWPNQPNQSVATCTGCNRTQAVAALASCTPTLLTKCPFRRAGGGWPSACPFPIWPLAISRGCWN